MKNEYRKGEDMKKNLKIDVYKCFFDIIYFCIFIINNFQGRIDGLGSFLQD